MNDTIFTSHVLHILDGNIHLAFPYLQALNPFLCKNCELEKYQCFACMRLGSAKTDTPEVNLF